MFRQSERTVIVQVTGCAGRILAYRAARSMLRFREIGVVCRDGTSSARTSGTLCDASRSASLASRSPKRSSSQSNATEGPDSIAPQPQTAHRRPCSGDEHRLREPRLQPMLWDRVFVLASAPQEVHLVGPAHSPNLASEQNQCPDEAPNVCRRDCLFIDKDHTTMGAPFLCPKL